MTGLIQKSGYIRPGTGGGHYAEYIATREGVELLEAPRPSHEGSGYLEYMAERPRSQGLFSSEGPADLEKTVEEINGHTGPVWTFIWSLRREDAARLGYENSESWRKLLLAHQTELAQAMKISPKNFRWRAAFHDEKHHPHVHVMVWSADPKQGFLTEQGIEKMRSRLSNEIFRDELLSLYQQKDLSYSQVRALERLWDVGFPLAAHQLGKCWRDGWGVLPDDAQAELWFRRAAEAGYDFSQYAFGKLLESQKRMGEAVRWYEKAAAQDNSWAPYRLGKLCLAGEAVPKEVSKAVEYLTASADQGNQYAQYALGKLYLTGQDVKQDWETAQAYFCKSAEQGNEYAQFFLEHFDQARRPNVFLSATRLLYHLGQIFRENSVPPAAPAGQHIDRKRWRKLQEKRIAMGHKPDDHEDAPRQDMGGMIMGW